MRLEASCGHISGSGNVDDSMEELVARHQPPVAEAIYLVGTGAVEAVYVDPNALEGCGGAVGARQLAVTRELEIRIEGHFEDALFTVGFAVIAE